MKVMNMFALLVYDIPADKSGTKRRNIVHKICKKYGYHVQNSVFELTVDYTQLKKIEHDIENSIDPITDSIRIYHIGKKRTETNVICLGRTELCESSDSCFII